MIQTASPYCKALKLKSHSCRHLLLEVCNLPIRSCALYLYCEPVQALLLHLLAGELLPAKLLTASACRPPTSKNVINSKAVLPFHGQLHYSTAHDTIICYATYAQIQNCDFQDGAAASIIISEVFILQ